MDFLVADPPKLHPPAAMATPVLDSEGAPLPGVLLIPAGPGPHPLVVLLNGFPGNERNADLAQALRRLGHAVLSFHYRGSWGTPGEWSWSNVLTDATNVLRGAASLPVDLGRIALVGHSLGGFAALTTAAHHAHVRAAVSICGFDLGTAGAQAAADPARRAAYVADFAGELGPLRGTSAESLVAEMESAAARWRLASLAPRLHGRPVLLVGAARDTVAVPGEHFAPLLRAYGGNPALEHALLDTDHALSDHRIALTRTVAAFLARALA